MNTKLTEKELELCRMIGAKWVSCDVTGLMVTFYNGEPGRHMIDDGHCLFYYARDGAERLGFLPSHCMPSMKAEDLICVE